jgi:hypothetical protein
MSAVEVVPKKAEPLEPSFEPIVVGQNVVASLALV